MAAIHLREECYGNIHTGIPFKMVFIHPKVKRKTPHILVFATVLLEVSEGYNEEALYNVRPSVPYKRWSPVKEFHYGEPVEIKRSLPSKRWSPVKEYHYDGPIEVKRGMYRHLKRWSPVKEFHYGEPIEI